MALTKISLTKLLSFSIAESERSALLSLNVNENISAKSSFTLAEIELLPLYGMGIVVLILLVGLVVGVIRLLEMLAGDIIVAAVVGIMWLLDILAGDIIVAVVSIMWLLEMIAGDIIMAAVVGIMWLLEILAGDIIVTVVSIMWLIGLDSVWLLLHWTVKMELVWMQC